MSSHIHILPDQTIKSPSDLNFAPQPSTFEGVQSNFLRTSSDNSTYNPTDTIQIRLRNNGNLMDIDNSYLSMRVNLTGQSFGTAGGFVAGFNQFAGVWSLISGIKMTASNGTVILNVPQNFDYFMTIVNEYLLDLGTSTHFINGVEDNYVVNVNTKAGMYHEKGQDCHFRFTQGVEPCQVSPASWHTTSSATGTIKVNTDGYVHNLTTADGNVDGTARVAYTDQMNSLISLSTAKDKVYIINPLGLFFQHGSMLPLFTDYTIELYLNQIQTALRVVQATNEATPSSLTVQPSYKISNVKFVAKNIMLPQNITNQLISLWETRGLHLTLTNVLPVPLNGDASTSIDTLRINAGGKRNITGLIVAPRANLAINNIYYDSYRRCKPDFNRLDLRVGDTILEPIESDVEAFNHVKNFFDNNVKSLSCGPRNSTYGATERGYFVEQSDNGLYTPNTSPTNSAQNIDTGALGYAGSSLLVSASASQRIFSSWLCAYDMSTFEDKSLNSGVSLSNIEFTYNLKNVYAGTSKIQWLCFVLYGSILRLSKSNVAEIFT